MKDYVEGILERLEKVLMDKAITIQPRQFKPGDKIALATLTHFLPPEEPTKPIYADEVDDVICIPPQHWENGRRPFDVNCVFAEIVESDKLVYEAQALLAPAILAQYPNVNVCNSPRFVSMASKEALTWDYADTEHFSWRDTEKNVGLYPYPVDTENPLYVDIEMFLITIIGLDGVFRTTIENLVRFFANYLEGDVKEIEQWATDIGNRFIGLHNLTYLQTTTNVTIH